MNRLKRLLMGCMKQRRMHEIEKGKLSWDQEMGCLQVEVESPTGDGED